MCFSSLSAELFSKNLYTVLLRTTAFPVYFWFLFFLFLGLYNSAFLSRHHLYYIDDEDSSSRAGAPKQTSCRKIAKLLEYQLFPKPLNRPHYIRENSFEVNLQISEKCLGISSIPSTNALYSQKASFNGVEFDVENRT